MSQWSMLHARGIRVRFNENYRYFIPENVQGDGNCFFQAVVQSPKFPMSDHLCIRHELTEWMEAEVETGTGNGEAIREEYLNHNLSMTRKLLTHINDMKKPSIWGTETEMLAFTLRFHILIVSCMNTFDEITPMDTLTIVERYSRHLSSMRDLERSLIIYLYYHMYGMPLISHSADNLNHFTLLHEVTTPLDDPYIGSVPVQAGVASGSTAAGSLPPKKIKRSAQPRLFQSQSNKRVTSQSKEEAAAKKKIKKQMISQCKKETAA